MLAFLLFFLVFPRGWEAKAYITSAWDNNVWQPDFFRSVIIENFDSSALSVKIEGGVD